MLLHPDVADLERMLQTTPSARPGVTCDSCEQAPAILTMTWAGPDSARFRVCGSCATAVPDDQVAIGDLDEPEATR